VTAGQGKACWGPSCCSSVPGAVDPITVNLYDRKQTEGLPAEAVLASLGCGNPTARENQRKAGVGNVEFLKGEIENIPLPDNTVDLIISNCVINLSADKYKVLAEAFRVLKPGGRFAVSDVVVRGEIPAEIRRNVALWVGCLSGALDESDYVARLERAGFENVSIEPTRVYRVDDAREFLSGHGFDVDAIARLVDGRFFSGFIRGQKPVAVPQPA
jgi:arsenite methyltransferase